MTNSHTFSEEWEQRLQDVANQTGITTEQVEELLYLLPYSTIPDPECVLEIWNAIVSMQQPHVIRSPQVNS